MIARLVIALALAGTACAAAAQATYTYTGNPFLYNGGCCGVSEVSGSFTVPSLLGANQTYDLVGLMTGYQFTDGRTSWNPSNYPGGPVPPFNASNEFVVTTDASGEIVSWQINIVAKDPDALISTQSLDYAGVGGTLDATNVYNNYVAYTVAPGNPNGQQGVPGIWSVSAVPEPETAALLLAGLAWLTIRQRRASSQG